MTRIYLYTIAYFISLGIYIFSGASESTEGLIFFTFLVSTLVYTFTRERLPTKQTQQFPEAFKYKSNRVNLYTQGMIIMLALLSFLFSANLQAKIVNPTIFTLIIWPIAIIGSYYLNQVHQKRELIYTISDYVNYKLNTQIDINLLKHVVESVKSGNDISRVPKTVKSGQTHFLRETRNEVINFLQSTDTPISYKEIEAVEDKNKV